MKEVKQIRQFLLCVSVSRLRVGCGMEWNNMETQFMGAYYPTTHIITLTQLTQPTILCIYSKFYKYWQHAINYKYNKTYIYDTHRVERSKYFVTCYVPKAKYFKSV